MLHRGMSNAKVGSAPMAEQVVRTEGEVTLRTWRKEDAAMLVRLGDDRDIWLNLRERFPHPFTEPAAQLWLADRAAEPSPATSLAILSRGELAGGVRFQRRELMHRMCADLSYWVGRPYWNKGIASSAVEAATEYGFDTLGLERVQAFVFDPNPASTHILEKAGFQLEGRLRRYVLRDDRSGDALLYARLRGD
jgi:RimJ/RimL family protein N-acetyltransferase